MATTTDARAWVGSLAAYNAGRLVGAWIDLDGKDAEDVADEARAAMRSQIAGWMGAAEAFDELWVFDHEGLGGLVRGECNVSEAVRAAETLSEIDEDRRDAFAAYAENLGGPADADGFEEAYAGDYSSEEDYARELADEIGMLDNMPENLRGYFDFQAFARDLFMSDYYGIRHAGGVYVFRND